MVAAILGPWGETAKDKANTVDNKVEGHKELGP